MRSCKELFHGLLIFSTCWGVHGEEMERSWNTSFPAWFQDLSQDIQQTGRGTIFKNFGPRGDTSVNGATFVSTAVGLPSLCYVTPWDNQMLQVCFAAAFVFVLVVLMYLKYNLRSQVKNILCRSFPSAVWMTFLIFVAYPRFLFLNNETHIAIIRKIEMIMSRWSQVNVQILTRGRMSLILIICLVIFAGLILLIVNPDIVYYIAKNYAELIESILLLLFSDNIIKTYTPNLTNLFNNTVALSNSSRIALFVVLPIIFIINFTIHGKGERKIYIRLFELSVTFIRTCNSAIEDHDNVI
ncbi:hypothetical protein HOLleu_23027 [Holothuria leucospilota]|uniref:Uncharacterized protein n=1 Tax=Holothuria leucospilota TaxID=206669 RepID=A0A9Q1BUL8_HOLLE|nr:hypothetical protein HOLleu_23027 [Holothuria leucospilota]